jgi:hypothetical protein
MQFILDNVPMICASVKNIMLVQAIKKLLTVSLFYAVHPAPGDYLL